MGHRGNRKSGTKDKRSNAGRPAPRPPIAAVAGGHDSTPAEHAPYTPWRFVFKLLGFGMVGGAIVLVPLMLWRVDTRIVADLVVKRLVFVPTHDTPLVTITDQPTAFEALTLEKFSKVSFRPARLEALHGTPGAPSARPLSVEPGTDIAIHDDGHGAASFSMAAPDGSKARVARLESFSARTPTVITIGTTQGSPAAFTISVAGQMHAPSILPSGTFDLTTKHTTLTGKVSKPLRDEVRLRVALSEASPYLEAESGAEGLTLTVTPVGAEHVRFLGKGGTAIDKVELISQNSHGDLESSLAGNGAISFPDFADKKSVALTENDALSLEDLAGMSIIALAFSPQQGLLHVKLEGTAGKVRSKSGTASTDHRSTLLDGLRHNGYLQALYALFAALVSALLVVVHVEEVWHRLMRAFRSPA